MFVAFASSNGERIDQHFGWSKQFYLYEISKESSTFIECKESQKEIEDEKEKLRYKIESLGGADILYCTQIGPTAAKMTQASGVYPVRVEEGQKIQDAIEKLQELLNNQAPPWLLRIYHKQR
ncbi:MAG: dinitrogenase iron-molybdenum cofactor biosynthesis protein [Helicobacteraceae bacterium]|jgi:nitrogen fixation protein NifX|nr:dinitrogenase iron-molybdenum cofactor biosynthesis protein [Helicobacteraceae bacterium]